MRRLLIGLLVGLVLVAPVLAQNPITPSAAVTGTMYDGRTPLLPKFLKIDAVTSGDNALLADVTDKTIRVVALFLTMSGTAVTIRFEGDNTGTALTGQMTPAQGQTIVLPFNPVGWFETTTDLNLELGGGQSVDGGLVYVEVDS